MNKTASQPSAELQVRQIKMTQPLHWLALAWQDMERCPMPGALHGLVMAAAGAASLVLAGHHFWLLAGLLTCFLLVSPVLATGLYAISRRLQQGQEPSLSDVWQVWKSGDRRLIRFGLLLALAGAGWVVTSASVITLLSPHPIETPMDFVQHILLTQNHWVLELWLMVGGLLAAPMFASSVVTIPLLLDRPVSLKEAVLTSWRVVLANPVSMGMWASLILLFTLLGLGSMLLGLLAVVPMLGHASWYAYQDLIGPADDREFS